VTDLDRGEAGSGDVEIWAPLPGSGLLLAMMLAPGSGHGQPDLDGEARHSFEVAHVARHRLAVASRL
jgi:hypothetical protein